jgi:hypothetical protein
MRIFDFRGHCDGDIAQVSARFQLDYGTIVSTLTYRFHGLKLCPSGIADAAAISLLPLALQRHEELDVHGTLSAPIARKLDLLQTRIAGQAPFHGPVAIKASGFDPGKPPRATDGSLGYCSFTGGASALDDPSYTHILLTRGFDRALDDSMHWLYAKRRQEIAARHFGRTLITCETNLPRIAGAIATNAFWHECLQSAAAAAITRLLGFVIGRIHVAAGVSAIDPGVSPAEVTARYASSQRLH